MSGWFTDGRILHAVLAILCLEFFALALIARAAARRASMTGLMLTVASGLLLVLAVLLMQADVDWRFAASSLGLSGLAHVADVIRRWRDHVSK